MKTKKRVTSFGNFMERNCAVSITLDKRTNRKDIEKYPLSVRFTINRKCLYVHQGGNYSPDEFSRICNTKRANTENLRIKRSWMQTLRTYGDVLSSIKRGHDLSIEMVRMAVTGRSLDTKDSFLGIWQEIIDANMNNGHFSTGESYECALKSFKKIVGVNTVKGFDIDKDIIELWDEGMRHGVRKTINGKAKLVGKLADATRGIYLRSCRAVWNECVSRGYLLATEYPFSRKHDDKLISIPKGAVRRDRFLSVDRMTRLYDIFSKKEYPTKWKAAVRNRVHYSLGLFLVQYLCNGFNLADAAELVYDSYYFSTGGKAFRFNRKKTAGRSSCASEVIIPIIEPLRKILDDIAAKPERDCYVFPKILNGVVTDKQIRRHTTAENRRIKNDLAKVCASIGWEEDISGTWARHSFATNLRDAGVDIQYISQSMGHSTNQSITSLYMAAYPLEKQFEYNNLLLNTGKKITQEDLKTMSKKQLRELLSKYVK